MDSDQYRDSGESQPSTSSDVLSSTSLLITAHRLVDGSSLGQKTEHPTTLSHGVSNDDLPSKPAKKKKKRKRRNTSLQVTIEILPADVLVHIFDFYRLDPLMHLQLGGRPWKWQKLSHVCKTWRSVLLASSHYLDLRLFFTNGMPVREILSSSPPLPIVMQYVRIPGSSPLTPGDQDNVMTLLELPTRLCEVQLIVTPPLLENVTTLMQQPFSVLESLHLSAPGLLLPSKFGGDMPRLRALRMVGIALPALPRLLLLAHDLGSLQLEGIPSVGYTPEALVFCLPAMTQLKTLRTYFSPPTSLPVLVNADRPLSSSSVLPILDFIEFRGTNEYLESLFFGIRAPLLEHFHIDFFNQLIFDTAQLNRFIHRTEMQRSHTHANIQCSVADISITLTQLEVPHKLSLRILCEQLDWQIPSMAEACDRLSPTLANVEQLEISASTSFPDEQDDMDLMHSNILVLFHLFPNVKRLCVTEASLSLVVGALGPVSGELAIVTLPELQEIQTEKHAELTSAQIGLAPFIAARRRSPRPVVVCCTAVEDVRSTSPISTVSSLAPSPVPSMDVPLPDPFSSPTHSPSHAPISPYPSPPHPRVYTPSPIPQPHAFPHAFPRIHPTFPIPRVYLHTALAAPSLQYDMRYPPNQSNLRLSPAVLAEPASSPPLPSLPIRVAGLPWLCTVRPDPRLSPGNAVVTVQDVLVCLYFHLHTTVKADEYNAMSRDRKAGIFQVFERRVGHDRVQRGKGLRRIDFLGGRIIVQGLVRAQSEDNVWDVIVR